MNNYTFLIGCCILLSSCAGYAGQAYNEAKSKADIEKQAWARVGERSIKECPGKGKPEDLKPSQAVAYSKCSTDLINQEVMPVATFPEMVIKMRATALRNSDLFAQGKISRSEWQARAMEGWANYSAAWDQRAKTYVDQASQQDQILAQQRTEYFQKVSSDLRKEELARQLIQSQNRARFTNCTGFGNSVNCISQ